MHIRAKSTVIEDPGLCATTRAGQEKDKGGETGYCLRAGDGSYRHLTWPIRAKPCPRDYHPVVMYLYCTVLRKWCAGGALNASSDLVSNNDTSLVCVDNALCAKPK